MTQLSTPHHLKPLTPRQRQVLDFIVDSQRAGVTPTIREICTAQGVTINAVKLVLEILESKGYIRHSPRQARSIKVLDTGMAETLWGDWPL
jgi:SOS-response transcriptional repressor LexA